MQIKSSSITDLSGIIQWYKCNCNDDWEHSYGVTLQTLDNPGWALTVDLIDTELDGQKMIDIIEGCDTENIPDRAHWIHCCIVENTYTAACDPDQLPRLFLEFDRLLSLKKKK